jgi:hypothetical protein
MIPCSMAGGFSVSKVLSIGSSTGLCAGTVKSLTWRITRLGWFAERTGQCSDEVVVETLKPLAADIPCDDDDRIACPLELWIGKIDGHGVGNKVYLAKSVRTSRQ